MKSKNAIQIEFEQVLIQAQNLENSADELNDIRKKINELVSNLSEGWKGENAEAYLKKCSELSEKINISRNDLHKTAGVIRKSAKAYRDAELASIRVTQN